MICKDCRDAADVDRQELHCNDVGCTCQHKPLDWLEEVLGASTGDADSADDHATNADGGQHGE